MELPFLFIFLCGVGVGAAMAAHFINPYSRASIQASDWEIEKNRGIEISQIIKNNK